MAGEDWKSFVRIGPWEGQLNFLSVEFSLMIGLGSARWLELDKGFNLKLSLFVLNLSRSATFSTQIPFHLF